jgi:HAD superfamily hydrolase (TIGR01662 family)
MTHSQKRIGASSSELAQAKWVFFDWGGTLKDEIAIYRDIAEVTASHLGSRNITVDRELLFSRLIEIEKSQQRIGVKEAIAEFGVSSEQFDDLQHAINSELHLNNSYPGVISVMVSLSRSHRLGIISNNNIIGFESFLAAEKFLSYFDVTVGSADAGVRKPEPAIFLMALEKAGCDPAESVMVGDRLNKDISGANRVGMHSVRIRQGIYADEEPLTLEEQPDYEISDIRDLPQLFGISVL